MDIPAALDEFLRVVKPGGCVLTAGDSFSVDAASDRDRLRVFDAQEAVLSGVNEQVPPIGHFLSPLERHGNALEVEIFTRDMHGADALGLPLMGFRRAGKKLRRKSGPLWAVVSACASAKHTPWIFQRPFSGMSGWMPVKSRI